MERNYGLNLIEEEQFKNMVISLPKDLKVQELCLKYYSEFKKHQTSIQSDKITLYLKCAYYLAQKSQWIQTVNGQKIRSAGFSLNELLKKHTLEDIMITLKEYSKRITIQDPQTLDDLQKLIKQISFLITFYNKFEKVLTKLELKDKNPGYAQTLSEFVWLLFIESKNKILNRSLELIDNTCMLAHALCFVLIYSWQFYQPGLFIKPEIGLNKLASRKQVNSRIHEKILQLFLIKSIDSYKNIAERFEAYFSYLKKHNVIRMTPGKDNFLSPEFLQSNYKRVDQIYEKKLNFNHLDERIFFKDRTANITPSKFTPFARQKVHIPNNRPKLGGNIGGFTDRGTQQVNYMSHRILNYENLQSQAQIIQPQVPASEIKFPKNIMQTPISTTTPLIQQTPYTTGLMMYNYVNELSNRLQQKKFCARKFDQLTFSLIDEVLDHAMNDENQKSRQIKRNHIFSVFKMVSEDFIALNPSDAENEEMMKAILLISFEIVFFVSNIDIEFDRLQKQLSIGQICLWRACDFFLKFDKSMPPNIKVHLLDLQVDIVSQKIWKNSETIVKIQSFCNNQKLPKDQQLIQKLCRRILHQIAFQIVQLCKSLSLQSRQVEQSTSEIAFETMKQILINYPQMIWSNNIDQIIMCTLFTINKCWKNNIKFQTIKDAYFNCNSHLSDNKKTDIFKKIVYDTENTQNQNKGIVGFYNACFITTMNQFIKNKCHNYHNNQSSNQTQRNNIQKDVNPLLQSPISGIIPNQINYVSKKIGNGTNKMINMKNIAPRLHAYTESPMLKNQFVTNKNPINSRKAIDYEQAEKNMMGGNKKQPLNDTCKLYQQNTQTNTFFNKKFATTKPGNKINSDIPALIKSPCNNQTKSPSQSPSPRVVDNTVVKQPYGNLYYAKRDFGKSMNNYM